MLNNNFVVNLSMLGQKNTGLGVYASHCAAILEEKFFCSIIASAYKSQYGTNVIHSPADIGFGTSSYASIKRIFYSAFMFPNNIDFVYTPTHHGVFGHNNQVITIHDLISVHHPKQHKFQYYYFRYVLPQLIQKCKAIFTVSEIAKQDICEYYHLKPEMIYVIPNGVDISRFYPKEISIASSQYLLVVGAAYQHKNIHELISNCQYWRKKYKLKIVSSRGKYAHYLKNLVSQYNLENDVEFCGYVTQEQLVELYQNCKALVFPSLWEGFGIPPLEALACGRPAIVSDITVHREILGDAAFYITLGDSSSWESAFAQLENVNIVAQKVDLGRQVLKKYTWENSGHKLVDALLIVEPDLQYCLKMTGGDEGLIRK
jgi:glycosyltransferase involved in cell wall biosynthesis